MAVTLSTLRDAGPLLPVRLRWHRAVFRGMRNINAAVRAGWITRVAGDLCILALRRRYGAAAYAKLKEMSVGETQ